ncbi:hypothetical protein BH18ACI4_BH18ACI4_28470 [soil metagenome]
MLFDLDGTLIDSRADLASSIGLMLAEMGQASLPDERVVSFIGEGVRALVERALRASQVREPESAQIDCALDIFRRHYSRHQLDRTRVYPEVHETLAHFCRVRKAVVTNKTLRLHTNGSGRARFALTLCCRPGRRQPPRAQTGAAATA